MQGVRRNASAALFEDTLLLITGTDIMYTKNGAFARHTRRSVLPFYITLPINLLSSDDFGELGCVLTNEMLVLEHDSLPLRYCSDAESQD